MTDHESALAAKTPLATAVLFLVFNRPETTARVFESVREARPPRLYVAADGPRATREGEAATVAKVRQIATAVDWPCEVRTLFREENLGCKRAVSEAITWFFDNEEQGIVLEDDCLPSQSFFGFCEQLLDHYADNERIMMVSGHNVLGQHRDREVDYFFSNVGGIWGWASWGRAWREYTLDLCYIEKEFQRLGDKLKHELGPQVYRARKAHLESLKNGLDTWDYQWSFTRHFNSGLSCVPSKNLIKNIGFGPDATHTTTDLPAIRQHDISLPVRHNAAIQPDCRYDTRIHGPWPFHRRLISRAARLIRGREVGS